MKKHLLVVLAIVCAMFAFWASATRAADVVTLAGFAFAGDYGTAATRFPYAFRVLERSKDAKNSISHQIIVRARTINNAAVELHYDEQVDLKQSDRALMVVLLLSDEVVSTENFGAYYKTFINLRGDALIFDYKSQNVVRSYPLSIVMFDASTSAPLPEKIQASVEGLLLGEDKNSLVSQFARRLSTATLPRERSKTVQVRMAQVSPEALALMPEALRQNPKAVESWLADEFGSLLSDKVGVPVLPNSIGHAAGIMSLRLENGDDYKLKLGEGDYLFDIKLNKFIKIKTDETSVGAAYVYGAYSSVRFYEPTLGTDYIKTDLKNGESSVVPSTQIASDDSPAYQDAIRGLLRKFSDALQQSGSSWVGAAASAKDINAQLDTARNILRTCK
ncbi:MAG: hypothetical protein JWN23_2116 [Rhodocyclales bacterium]|nr:hypothetical protein [Rhodocyclales bacterium]